MTKSEIQKKTLRRRRFIKLAASTGFGLFSAPFAAAGLGLGAPTPYRWQGRLLGADVSLSLFHPDEKYAAKAVTQITAEINRLADVFSLYEPESEISRLNRDGTLLSPAFEMHDLLTISRELWTKTKGLFDPTIQPLFKLYANHYAQAGRQTPPTTQQIEETLSYVGLDKVLQKHNAIELRKPGMALSFNGIAQGYMTDRAHAILKELGFEHALVNMGEYRALGGKPISNTQVQGWHIGVADALRPWQVFETIELQDRAISTSAPGGAAFENSGRHHHLLNPKTGLSENHYTSVTVIAPQAVIADGLSTSLALLPPEEALATLAGFKNTSALLRPLEGPAIRFRL